MNKMRTATCAQRTVGFTLVELLVVISIIGILAGLLLVGVNAAMRAAKRTQILTEIHSIDAEFQKLKQSTNAYPPNCLMTYSQDPAGDPQQIAFNDLKRYLKTAYPRNQEPDTLLAALVTAYDSNTSANTGMNPAEAVVFWLGGFSEDARYPISGKGGPSYNPTTEQDPFNERSGGFEFDPGRLGPRDADGHFNGRSIKYVIGTPPQQITRRIDLWTYHPPDKKQPYLYFDTSRHEAIAHDRSEGVDPIFPIFGGIVAIKRLCEIHGIHVEFVNPKSFQILHAGIDDEWGDWSEFAIQGDPGNLRPPTILFPTGPFTDELADTLTNFSQKELADSEE